MYTQTMYGFDHEERKMFTDTFSPLVGLCTDGERARRVASWLDPHGGNMTYFDENKIIDICNALDDLLRALLPQTDVNFWKRIGMPSAEDLAQMRKNEYVKIDSLYGLVMRGRLAMNGETK